jgi:hypothetical protein
VLVRGDGLDTVVEELAARPREGYRRVVREREVVEPGRILVGAGSCRPATLRPSWKTPESSRARKAIGLPGRRRTTRKPRRL